MKDVLLVDDDAELLQSLARALSPLLRDLTLCGASRRDDALSIVERDDPRVVLLDLCLDDRVGIESGFECLREIRRRSSHVRVIVLTGHGSVSHGVRALSFGASSFVEKPADPAHLAALIRDAALQSQLRREHERLLAASQRGSAQGALCGSSAAMRELRERIEFAAATPQSVLLLGETGTGKGLCARAIHEASAWRTGKFVHYQPNFGGGDIVQSELFGHVRGAFTGAAEARRGLVLEAANGALFIDELDEVPHEAQVKLLDLLQERRIRPLGADACHPVDCRFIAATNRNIEQCLASAKIRRDLHHRIAQCVVRVPPLRERREDIPLLCDRFLSRLRELHGLNVFDLTDEALQGLAARGWEGNVRELQAVVETAAFFAGHRGRSVIEASDLDAGAGRLQAEGSGREARSLSERVESFKAEIIQEALERANGNQAQAARLLGIDRGTLRRAAVRLSGDRQRTAQ